LERSSRRGRWSKKIARKIPSILAYQGDELGMFLFDGTLPFGGTLHVEYL
jgi:hypothetical protein